MIKIETTSYEYTRVVSYAAQLSQSSHMALQLPYVILGLGTTPNFVEYLTVGILSITTNKNVVGFHKEWHQIVPNSQLVISPNPRDFPY
jgi:integrin alpha FG-GAP repeat containing protein 1